MKNIRHHCYATALARVNSLFMQVQNLCRLNSRAKRRNIKEYAHVSNCNAFKIADIISVFCNNLVIHKCINKIIRITKQYHSCKNQHIGISKIIKNILIRILEHLIQDKKHKCRNYCSYQYCQFIFLAFHIFLHKKEKELSHCDNSKRAREDSNPRHHGP